MSPRTRGEVLLARSRKKRVVSVTGEDRDVVWRLAKQGSLHRVARGLYVTGGKPSPARALAAFLSQHPMAYLGGDWALWLHDHLDSVPRRADLFVSSPLRPRKLAGYPVRFTALAAPGFGHGLVVHTFDGVKLRISDLERTLLDALDHPRLFGDFEGGVLLLADCLSFLDEERLVEYAVRGSTTPTRQRLGALLEAGKADERLLELLAEYVEDAPSSLSMLPGKPRCGRWYERWSLIDNRPGVEPREH